MIDPLAVPRRLLAEIHAETLHEEKRLRLMHTAGMDHFSQGLAMAVPAMTDADLDGYTREAGARGVDRDRQASGPGSQCHSELPDHDPVKPSLLQFEDFSTSVGNAYLEEFHGDVVSRGISLNTAPPAPAADPARSPNPVPHRGMAHGRVLWEPGDLPLL